MKILSYLSVVPLAIVAQLTYHARVRKALPRWKVWSIIGSALFVSVMAGYFAEYMGMASVSSNIFVGLTTLFSEHVVFALMIRGDVIGKTIARAITKILKNDRS